MAGTKRKSAATASAKPKQAPDFKKLKSRVGKKAKKPENHTSTQFKVRAIHVKEQLTEKEGVTELEDEQQQQQAKTQVKLQPHQLLTSRHLTLYDLLQQCSHHNSNVRCDALKQMEELCVKFTYNIYPALNVIHDYISQLIIDDDKRVRDALQSLLALLLPTLQQQHLLNAVFIRLYVSYINIGVCHLIPSIRRQSLVFLHLFLKHADVTTVDGNSSLLATTLWECQPQLLPNLLATLADKVHNVSVHETTLHSSAMESRMNNNHTGNKNSTKSVINFRLLIVECVEKLLRLGKSQQCVDHSQQSADVPLQTSHVNRSSLDETISACMTLHQPNATNNNTATAQTPLALFTQQAVPLLTDYWLDSAPETITSIVASQYGANKDTTAINQLQTLVHIAEAFHHMLQLTPQALSTTLWQSMEQHVFTHFPFTSHSESTLHAVSTLNLQLFSLLSYYLDDQATDESAQQNALQRMVEYIVACFEQLSDQQIAKQVAQPAASPASAPAGKLSMAEINSKIKQTNKQQRQSSQRRYISQSAISEMMPLLQQTLATLSLDRQLVVLHAFDAFYRAAPIQSSTKLASIRLIHYLLQSSHNGLQLLKKHAFVREWVSMVYNDLCTMSTISTRDEDKKTAAIGHMLSVIQLVTSQYSDVAIPSSTLAASSLRMLQPSAKSPAAPITQLQPEHQHMFVQTLYHLSTLDDTMLAAIRAVLTTSKSIDLQSDLLQLLAYHHHAVDLSQYISILLSALVDRSADADELAVHPLTSLVAQLLTKIDAQSLVNATQLSVSAASINILTIMQPVLVAQLQKSQQRATPAISTTTLIALTGLLLDGSADEVQTTVSDELTAALADAVLHTLLRVRCSDAITSSASEAKQHAVELIVRLPQLLPIVLQALPHQAQADEKQRTPAETYIVVMTDLVNESRLRSACITAANVVQSTHDTLKSMASNDDSIETRQALMSLTSQVTWLLGTSV